MINPDKQHFAVFGDIHGRVTLMYTVALLWQIETGIQLSGMLQVGDMGAFPNPLNIDEATHNHSREDPDELDFCHYCKLTSVVSHTELADQLLNHPASPPTYFIKGNHEDFDYLSQFNSPATVDLWEKIHYIPDGKIIKLPPSIHIGAFGGISPTVEEKGDRGKRLRKKFKKARFKAKTDPKYFTEKSVKQAFQQDEHIDILLTHKGPLCPPLSQGSMLLAELSERIKPKIHIFGHHHKALSLTEGPGNSILVGLDHFKFDRSRTKIVAGSWGILTMQAHSINFLFPNISDSSVLSTITYNNYREVISLALSNT
jgi:predicted phosphohydrolase